MAESPESNDASAPIGAEFILEKMAGSHLVPNVFVFRSLASTNDHAMLPENADLQSGTVIVAEEQTGGRGRRGRQWHSPPFLGLWFSIVLRPCFKENITLLPLALGLAVAKSLENMPGLAPDLKWPNDVLLSGRKVCGILCECRSDAAGRFRVVAGIGINVNQDSGDFSAELRPYATSLLLETGNAHDRADLLVSVLCGIESVLAELEANRSGKILEEWTRRCPAIGKPVSVADGEVVSGRFLGIDSIGRMILSTPDGSRRLVAAGDFEDNRSKE